MKTFITHTYEIIIVYNYDGKAEKVFNNFDKDQSVLCCVPCDNDKYIIAAVVNKGNYSLVVIDQATKETVMTFEETDLVMDILTVPGKFQFVRLGHLNKIHTYHSRFIPKGVAEASQIFLQDATFYRNYLAMGIQT
jgi:hypothetical protein